MMSFFKFTPDLMDKDDLESLSVGRSKIVDYATEKIENAIKTQTVSNLLFVGQRGIGKSHMLLRIMRNLNSKNIITPVRFSEEEYSISTIEHLFSKILEILNVEHNPKDVIFITKQTFKDYSNHHKPIVLFVENLQMLFDQMEEDLPKLRSIIQEERNFFIIGSALSTFEQITSPKEPFYNFFEVIRILGLTEDEVSELIRKRLEFSDNEQLIKSFNENENRVTGLHILTGGNPRLVHILCEIIIQKSSIDDLEKNLLQLLDQLTPFYQARMETISKEKRKILDTLALADGPLTPTELANTLQMKNTIVISQLRRLQKEGYVESIKFKDKKSTRYQITERLYRIWRELRTPHGATKVKLFVEFLKIWYSRSELFDQYQITSKKVDSLLYKLDENVHHEFKKMCYILDAIPDIELINLEDVIEKYVKLGDVEAARKEIQRVKNSHLNQNDPVFIHGSDIIFDWATKLTLEKKSKQYEIAEHQIHEKIKEFAKLEVNNTNDKLIRYTRHQIYETVAQFALNIQQFEIAKRLNNMATNQLEDGVYCPIVNNLRIVISFKLKNYEDVLNETDQILKNERNDPEAKSFQIKAHCKLGHKDEAIKIGKELIETNIEYLSEGLHPFLYFQVYDSIPTILQNNLNRIKIMDDLERDELIERVFIFLVDELIHTFNSKKSSQLIIKTLDLMKEIIPEHIILKITLNIAISHPSHIKELDYVLTTLETIFGKEKVLGLNPLRSAVSFILTNNTDIFEKIHPEYRELAINLIKKLSPNTIIPQLVNDSL